VQPTDLAWWYGTMGESVFDRYSFVHAFMFVWVAIALAFFLRNPLELFIAMAFLALSWEMFESHVLTGLQISQFEGTETVRNRYIGDTISDLAGYVTFLTAAFAARRGMMWRTKKVTSNW
jgi:hypothetical protein